MKFIGGGKSPKSKSRGKVGKLPHQVNTGGKMTAKKLNKAGSGRRPPMIGKKD